MTSRWTALSGHAGGPNTLHLVEDRSPVDIGWPEVGGLHDLNSDGSRPRR